MKKYFSITALAIITVFSLTFISCGGDDDDDVVNKKPIMLYVGEETRVPETTNLESENNFVAFATSNNKIKGFHVGETFVKTDGNVRIPIIVNWKYKTHDDPVIEWGCSQEYVKSRHKQGTLSSNSDSKNLVYEKAGHADIIAYSFENDKLEAVVTFVSTKWTLEYCNYLVERFLVVPYNYENETYYVLIDALEKENAKTLISLGKYNSNYLSCIYTKYPVSSNAKARLPQRDKSNNTKIKEIAEYLNK